MNAYQGIFMLFFVWFIFFVTFALTFRGAFDQPTKTAFLSASAIVGVVVGVWAIFAGAGAIFNYLGTL